MQGGCLVEPFNAKGLLQIGSPVSAGGKEEKEGGGGWIICYTWMGDLSPCPQFDGGAGDVVLRFYE